MTAGHVEGWLTGILPLPAPSGYKGARFPDAIEFNRLLHKYVQLKTGLKSLPETPDQWLFRRIAEKNFILSALQIKHINKILSKSADDLRYRIPSAKKHRHSLKLAHRSIDYFKKHPEKVTRVKIRNNKIVSYQGHKSVLSRFKELKGWEIALEPVKLLLALWMGVVTHEAGHAMIALDHGWKVITVNVVPRVEGKVFYFGYTLAETPERYEPGNQDDGGTFEIGSMVALSGFGELAWQILRKQSKPSTFLVYYFLACNTNLLTYTIRTLIREAVGNNTSGDDVAGYVQGNKHATKSHLLFFGIAQTLFAFLRLGLPKDRNWDIMPIITYNHKPLLQMFTLPSYPGVVFQVWKPIARVKFMMYFGIKW